jgi:uncharacterized protein YndB with AHSA1/START domain
MSGRSMEHESFSIERRYEATPAQVFAAWADPAAKARWFKDPDSSNSAPHQLDFRVGGSEVTTGGPQDGPVHEYRAVYWDIVEDERIVYTYEMLMDGTRVSVSLTSIELKPDGDGTRLHLTEQGVFLDGHEPPPQRAQGTGWLLDALGEELRRH